MKMKARATKTKITAFIIAVILTGVILVSCGGGDSFSFEITDKDGVTKTFAVKSAEKILGDALIEDGYIPADSKTAGTFDTLNGVTADFFADGAYWGFYINGEMYMDGGVFDVEANKDDEYSFRYEIFVFE